METADATATAGNTASASQNRKAGERRRLLKRRDSVAGKSGSRDRNRQRFHAALEACAGSLSRAFQGATVEGPQWAKDAVNPMTLAQMGRDLVRSGSSMHIIAVDHMGRVELLPCSSWHFEGGASRSTWYVRATVFGPSTSETHYVSYDGVVWLAWGSAPGTPYVGDGPTAWASATNRMLSATERSLADEAGGPVAQLLPVPGTDGGDDTDTDTTKELRADITNARGRAVMLETTAAGFGEGHIAAPQRDWVASRLGPMPPPAMAEIARDGFARMVAAAGAFPGMFESGADGTSQMQSARRWYLLTVLSVARLAEFELSLKLETPITLEFPNLRYFADMQVRAGVVQWLEAAGVELTDAMAEAGLGG